MPCMHVHCYTTDSMYEHTTNMYAVPRSYYTHASTSCIQDSQPAVYALILRVSRYELAVEINADRQTSCIARSTGAHCCCTLYLVQNTSSKSVPGTDHVIHRLAPYIERRIGSSALIREGRHRFLDTRIIYRTDVLAPA